GMPITGIAVAHTYLNASLSSTIHSYFFFLLLRPPPTSTLFHYTTLFRSAWSARPICSHSGYTGEYRYPSRRPLPTPAACRRPRRSEEHTSELQSRENLVCRLLLEKKNKKIRRVISEDFLRHVSKAPASSR